MTKKIIAIDLDGTLLHSDKTISDYTANVIKQVRNLGHSIIITTGRPFRMAIKYYQQLGLDTPMISFNGSLTNIPDKSWQYERSLTIDKHFLIEIINRSQMYEMDFIASEYRKNFYITLDYPQRIEPSLFGVETITKNRHLKVDKITKNPNALLMQTRVDDKYELAKTMRKDFNNNIEIDSWGGPKNILEASPKGVNKANALSYLLNIYNKTANDLICFGDEHNDTEMLHLAKTGYAMKNANTILLPFADLQLPYTNDQDGVAKQLEKLFL